VTVQEFACVSDDLTGLQDAIDAQLARVEGALDEIGDQRVAVIGNARWHLARALDAYQVAKHRGIFDPLIAACDPRASAARRMKDECIRTAERYRAFVVRWSMIAILDEWAAYKAAALEMATVLRNHLAREREELDALLAAGSVHRRDAA
jgi:hypothetical protein